MALGQNGFELGLNATDDPRASGVRWVAWEVCRARRDELLHEASALGQSRRARSSTLPAPGEWKTRAWAATDVRRTGPKSAWSEPLRFDDAAPGGRPGRRGHRVDERRRGVERRRQLPGRLAPRAVGHLRLRRHPGRRPLPGTTVTERGDRVLVALGRCPRARPACALARSAAPACRRRRSARASSASTARRRSCGSATDGAPARRAGGRVAAAGRAPVGPRRRPGAALRDGARRGRRARHPRRPPRVPGRRRPGGPRARRERDDRPAARRAPRGDGPRRRRRGQRQQPAARELPRRSQQAGGNDRRDRPGRAAPAPRASPRSASSSATARAARREEHASGPPFPVQLEQRGAHGARAGRPPPRRGLHRAVPCPRLRRQRGLHRLRRRDGHGRAAAPAPRDDRDRRRPRGRRRAGRRPRDRRVRDGRARPRPRRRRSTGGS